MDNHLFPLIISELSREWLINQRGDFAHLASRRDEWLEAFRNEVQKTLYQIYENTDGPPASVLDIGSGLGAVDICFAKAYGAYCTLVDSEHGTGHVRRHAEPFCNYHAVMRFWDENAVPRDSWRYCDPVHLTELPPFIYDLVLSLRSWCFHYPPSAYLDYVLKNVKPGARLIVDMRTNKQKWIEQMCAVFDYQATIETGEKYMRMVFVVKGRLQ